LVDRTYVFVFVIVVVFRTLNIGHCPGWGLGDLRDNIELRKREKGSAEASPSPYSDNVKLKLVYIGALYLLYGLSDFTFAVDDRLFGELLGPADHVLRGASIIVCFGHGEDALNGDVSLAEDDKGEFGAHWPGGLYTSTEEDIVVDIGINVDKLVPGFVWTTITSELKKTEQRGERKDLRGNISLP
jgi:hypothetical protein